ncbi:MAG: Ger(x)C family spore germination protein, partial [Mycobacterium leprae]
QELGGGSTRSTVIMEQPRLAADLVTARGQSVGEAIQVLNGAMSRRLDLRHLRAVVAGEELGHKGLGPLVAEMLQSPLTRTSALFLQARGSAHAVMNALRPVAETNPAHLVEGFSLQAKQMHLGPPVLMHHFLNRLAGGAGDAYLPMIAINENVEAGADLPAPNTSSTAIAGTTPRAGGNPVEMVGTAIYRADKFVGVLTVDETQMLLALRGKMGKAPVTLPDPLAPGHSVYLRLHQENLPKYKATLQAGKPHIAVHLLFEGEVLAVPSRVNYAMPTARAQLQQAASAYVGTTCRAMLAKLRSWEADPVGFGGYYAGRFPSWEAWHAFNWPSHVGDLTAEVTAQLRVRRYGLVLGRTPVDEGR